MKAMSVRRRWSFRIALANAEARYFNGSTLEKSST
jgi:hypothetical protein